ncbi:transposase [Photorhabdus laumondii subsp. laumondii]|uniref:Transposase n=1 Tax=Photorhabdus laumondii subsp. laumondii TaxID=141679 RepID=A0A6L9JUW2_PHOLM|nr:hypothetical protein [Photorhabdus noenieputensis]MCC8385695.1 integrase core domain-containing protein [Photorhabdus laumondii]MCZ1250047.1 hypothetical protein [Photorhabdus laumondii subsp. laumondii]MCC8388403.1 integrase core domain-containing protein [Photorhabdus laumondii]MCC8414568.1 integrase core domain-containing protein [Photorhabdus laumondii]
MCDTRIGCDKDRPRGLILPCRTPEQWAYHNSAELRITQLGKLTQNKFIESFNSHFRDKCLNSMILKDL